MVKKLSAIGVKIVISRLQDAGYNTNEAIDFVSNYIYSESDYNDYNTLYNDIINDFRRVIR